jgi:hypothetical protein
MRDATIEDIRMELWLRERDSGNIAWKTKEGYRINIQDMSNVYLRNVLQMLERREELEELACEYQSYLDDLD